RLPEAEREEFGSVWSRVCLYPRIQHEACRVTRIGRTHRRFDDPREPEPRCVSTRKCADRHSRSPRCGGGDECASHGAPDETEGGRGKALARPGAYCGTWSRRS